MEKIKPLPRGICKSCGRGIIPISGGYCINCTVFRENDLEPFASDNAYKMINDKQN